MYTGLYGNLIKFTVMDTVSKAMRCSERWYDSLSACFIQFMYIMLGQRLCILLGNLSVIKNHGLLWVVY